MIWTLCVLAVSMSGAAGLLHSFDPYSGIEGTVSPEQLRRVARSLVRDDVPLEASRWKTVEILRGPTDVAGATLSASADPTESHFYVDSRGRLSRSSRWRKQSPSPTAPTSIRIQIASDENRPMTANQWYAVQAMIDALDETIRKSGRKLPVQTDDVFGDVQFFAPVLGDRNAGQFTTTSSG
ncbi:MAG: hypothetical protein HY287_14845 [Planctomycetes bacterium]|nr:hypothetical protein [Planctomycetota bacterium]MBI3835602.1 hypothetical protein [Planctomycetota bacterium]